MKNSPFRLSFLAAVCALAIPAASAAQDAVTQPVNQGPMKIERVENGWAIAPEFRYGRVDEKDAWFAGAYGGWLYEKTLLIGAGGYWQTNETTTRDMAYGGAVVGWLVGADRPIGFSARALIGGGRATITGTLGDIGFDCGRDRRGPCIEL